MENTTLPYVCHVMVCLNDRQGRRKSCADGNSPAIRDLLKSKVKEKGWDKSQVRVSRTLCLGLCSLGPNVAIYPQNILFSEVSVDDVDKIINTIEDIMASHE